MYIFLGIGYRTFLTLSVEILTQNFKATAFYHVAQSEQILPKPPTGKEMAECCLKGRLQWAGTSSCTTYDIGPWEVGMNWASGGQAFQKDWHEQRYEACLGHSKWTYLHALGGSHARAPGDKVNKEVRLPGSRRNPHPEGIWHPMRARAF